MIEIVLMDDRGFINDWKHFYEDELDAMIKYLRFGIQQDNTTQIKVKKWKDGKKSEGK